jgi:hypothetical protein
MRSWGNIEVRNTVSTWFKEYHYPTTKTCTFDLSLLSLHPQPTAAYPLPLIKQGTTNKTRTKAAKMARKRKGNQKAPAKAQAKESRKRGIDQVGEEKAGSKSAKGAKPVLRPGVGPLPAIGDREKSKVYLCGDGSYKRWNGTRLDPVCQRDVPGGCNMIAQGGPFCKGHGGGKRCEIPKCLTPARGGSKRCFACRVGKRRKIEHCTSPVSKNEPCQRPIGKKRPRGNKSASAAAVRKVTAPAANVAKVNPFGEARSPRLSALVAALKSHEPIAVDAMASLSSAMRTLNEFLTLDALMKLHTRTPPAGARVGDEASAVQMLATLNEGTRGVKFGNAQDGSTEFPHTAGTVDAAELTFLAGIASSVPPLPPVHMHQVQAQNASTALAWLAAMASSTPRLPTVNMSD